jgi:hypothetical protein
VRERSGLAQVVMVMVGARGMRSHLSIHELRGQCGMDWITALKGVSIRSPGRARASAAGPVRQVKTRRGHLAGLWVGSPTMPSSTWCPRTKR